MAPRSHPIFIVHSATQARDALAAAAEAGVAILLLSGTGAGLYAGPGWFRALIEGGRDRHGTAFLAGAILDCGADAGAALAAIREGVKTICYSGSPATRRRLNEIATVAGVSIRPRGTLWRRALDLDRVAARQRCEACADWILPQAKRMPAKRVPGKRR